MPFSSIDFSDFWGKGTTGVDEEDCAGMCCSQCQNLLFAYGCIFCILHFFKYQIPKGLW